MGCGASRNYLVFRKEDEKLLFSKKGDYFIFRGRKWVKNSQSQEYGFAPKGWNVFEFCHLYDQVKVIEGIHVKINEKFTIVEIVQNSSVYIFTRQNT